MHWTPLVSSKIFHKNVMTWTHFAHYWLIVRTTSDWQIPLTKASNVWHNFNSLAPGKFEWNFRHVVMFKQILVIDGCGISCEIAIIWMSLDFTDDQSTLVQVMAWCRQATSHYLSQCWPKSLSPYGITRPQWVNVGSSTAGCVFFKAESL